jgi:hypothetical protein
MGTITQHHRRLTASRLFVFFICFLLTISLQASEIAGKERKEKMPLISNETEVLIDEKQEEFSGHLITAATWFDSFFDNERYSTEENRTTARLKLSAGIDKHENFEFKPRVRLRLHLPRANNRLNLVVSANDDEDFDVERGVKGTNSRDDDADLTVGLQYFLAQTKSMNISTTAGVSFNYVYGGLRYRSAYDYGSWQGRLVSRFLYYTDDGFEFRNQYDVERQVSDALLFRTTLDVNWEESVSGVPHGLMFSLFQVLSADQALQYEIGNYFETSPSYQLSDMVFQLRYRQRFYRDWLVAEVAPMVSFPKEYDREMNPGIIFRLEVEFGHKSYTNQFGRIFSF